MTRVLVIDQGTTATKTYTLDLDGRFSCCYSAEHHQIYPQPGWVEHDPEALLRNVLASIEAAAEFEAIGIDNQGETVIAWDSNSGLAIYNAIVWQDQRTTGFIEELKAAGAEQLTLERAGLPLDSYFSASKLRWILEHAPEAGRLLREGRLRFGTSESFFIYRMTGEYATDVTTASRTSLMNLRTCAWDAELCELFGVPIEILPEIRPTTAYFGSLRSKGQDIPITASVVDQQAALFGHGCYETGQTKITFGTGVFALANVGEDIQSDQANGILSTVAWQFTNDVPVYAIDAGVYNAGSAINWVKSLGLFHDMAEIDHFENAPAISRGLVFVPALSGLACPFWDRSAAGLWLGLSLETTKTDLCQAVLEGIAFRTAQLLDAMTRLTGEHQRLSVDGGLTKNAYFCQFLADLTGCEIIIPASPDITPLGAGRFALIGSGLAKCPADLPPAEEPKAIIEPRKDLAHSFDFTQDKLKHRFNEAIKRSRNWR